MTTSPERGVAPVSLSLLDRGRLYLAAVDSQVVGLASVVLYLGASLVPWDGVGTDLWSFGIGRLGGLSGLSLLVWRVAMLVRPSASERLVPLRCAILGSFAALASAYELVLILFAPEPPKLVYRGPVSWGESVMIAATVILLGATSYCWFAHLRDWPPRGFRWRTAALFAAGSSALAYVVLCVTTHWFTYCTPTTTTNGLSSLKNLESMFSRVCSSESYRTSALGELASFFSVVLLISVIVAALGLRPVESLARSATGALAVGVGVLAIFVVIEALRTRSTVTEHVQLGGWLAMALAVPLVASGLSLIRGQ